jgi:hypothetical protein
LNRFTGIIEIMINPDGSVLPTTLYSSPSSVNMDGAFYHFWLAERSDVHQPIGTTTPTLPVGRIAGVWVYQGPGIEAVEGAPSFYAGPVMSGEYRLVTLTARTGMIQTFENPHFDNPTMPILGAYQPGLQYQDAQIGSINRRP